MSESNQEAYRGMAANPVPPKLPEKNWEDFILVGAISIGVWLGGGRHLKTIARNTAATRASVEQIKKLVEKPVMVLASPTK